MRRHRHTKIVATLGPASSTEETIEALFQQGADVFRLNFSHGTYEDHQARYDILRALEEKHHHPVGVLADLQGPKLRVGNFKQGRVILKKDQLFQLDLDETDGDEKRVCLPHPEIFKALKKEDDLLLDDGRINLKVVDIKPDALKTRVIVGGELSNHKGVNVPGVALPISPLTDKDRADLTFALEMGADLIALSFVQRPEDILEAQELIQGRAKIVSKLEKPKAIEHLEKIIRLSDAVMVARGDLGVEMRPEDVPSVQKRIIRACRVAGRPVIVATQMLDSMIHAPTPTRAEASDVATAVYDGVDAVMLSGESASGDYPVEAVSMMNRIIQRVEKDPLYRNSIEAQPPIPEATTSDAITVAARHVTQTVAAKVIVTYTSSGSTSLRAARERPPVPILGITSTPQTYKILTLVWGVHPVLIDEGLDFSKITEETRRIVEEQGFAEVGDKVILTAGVPFNINSPNTVFEPGTTNLLRIFEMT